MRILVVEDDPDVGDALSRRLGADGHGVDWLRDGVAADEVLRYQEYALVLLDIGLPGIDGVEVLRRLRARGNDCAVLMLTARSDVEHRINALDCGADDYLAKPFDARELDARCRALLRRSQGASSNITAIGTLEFDRGAQIVRLGGMDLVMPRREFRLLEIFVGSLGAVLSKDAIAERLFDFDDEASANAIETYVGRLRRRVEPALVIRTVRGLGYVAEPGGR